MCFLPLFAPLYAAVKIAWLSASLPPEVKYISLVNLIANKEVVRELVADTMTVANIRSELESVLYNKVYREQMMVEYERIIQILGPAGASRQAARQMVSLLKK